MKAIVKTTDGLLETFNYETFDVPSETPELLWFENEENKVIGIVSLDKMMWIHFSKDSE